MTLKFNHTQNFSISQNALCAKADDETMIMDIEQGKYFVLNAVGTRIWDMLESSTNGMQHSEIIEQLQQHYDAEIALITHEADIFLGQLLERKLVYMH